MKLQGKCKEEFEKWYIKKYYPNAVSIPAVVFELDDFYKLHDNKKIGVYEDYFDSVGVEFYIKPMTTSLLGSTNVVKFNNQKYIYAKSKKEARDKGVEKACEIRNEQL